MTETVNLLISLVAGLGVALTSGYLGIFVISQRLAFFSDALAHAALLGISASLLLALPMQICFIVIALVFAVFFSTLLTRANLSSDTLIGILAHSFLALSLLSISLFAEQEIELEHYLFGDLLHISVQQLAGIAICLLLSAIFLLLYWQDLILLTLHEELAQVEGINTQRLRLLFTLLLALLVAVSIQLIGALLISALLIIPAAAARQWSHSPLRMAFGASIVACLAVIGGLALCYFANTPSGPSIVVVASCIFVVSLTLKLAFTRNRR